MTNMRRGSKKKQMSKRKRGMAALQNEEGSYSRQEPMEEEPSLEMEDRQHGSAEEAPAHQIYQEKRGDDLDNWLEEKRIVLRKEHYK